MLFPKCILHNLEEASVPAWPLKQGRQGREVPQREAVVTMGLETLHKMLDFQATALLKGVSGGERRTSHLAAVVRGEKNGLG